MAKLTFSTHAFLLVVHDRGDTSERNDGGSTAEELLGDNAGRGPRTHALHRHINGPHEEDLEGILVLFRLRAPFNLIDFSEGMN